MGQDFEKLWVGVEIYPYENDVGDIHECPAGGATPPLQYQNDR